MQIFYIKAESKIEVSGTEILLKDIAVVLCSDDELQKKAEELVVYRFDEPVHRVVMNVVTVIGLLQEEVPDAVVMSLGEADIVIERLTGKTHPVWDRLKIGFIALICFFGASFTIMAFHNDISIDEIFSRVYELFTGKESSGFTVLEITYSIGLSFGIVLFFNHIGKRRITKDPTPVEVQMRQYEENVVTTLVETADRNQEEL